MSLVSPTSSAFDVPPAGRAGGLTESPSPQSAVVPRAIELWGGVECTVNRVGDEYFDQLARSGHDHRDADLGLFAGLGLRTLRYPILWERVAPRGTRSAEWDWPDRRLECLRELGVEPIVGLLHHGSGPLDTSLLDPSFSTRFANYARAIAERYPWVEAYTPIDEPLVTARMSGLHGRWYPHGRDDRTFVRVLMTQCRAIVLAMTAIRRVNSNARLVQTEDLGHVRSTQGLSYQANFENERRFLTFDLLSGRVVPGHPLYGYLVRSQASPAELARFADRPCVPDLFGVNYHVESERFLDDRLSLYPPALHGGNQRQHYADVGAVSVCEAGLLGPAFVLGEAWRRYRAPLAITETQFCRTPDERMRWLVHLWREARFARNRGVDVRAVTAWALLGSHDRGSHFARDDGHYEPGVFALVDGEPRPSIVADAVRSLARGHEPENRILGQPGWWQRSGRLRPSVSDRAPLSAREGYLRAAE